MVIAPVEVAGPTPTLPDATCTVSELPARLLLPAPTTQHDIELAARLTSASPPLTLSCVPEMSPEPESVMAPGVVVLKLTLCVDGAVMAAPLAMEIARAWAVGSLL